MRWLCSEPNSDHQVTASEFQRCGDSVTSQTWTTKWQVAIAVTNPNSLFIKISSKEPKTDPFTRLYYRSIMRRYHGSIILPLPKQILFVGSLIQQELLEKRSLGRIFWRNKACKRESTGPWFHDVHIGRKIKFTMQQISSLLPPTHPRDSSSNSFFNLQKITLIIYTG